MKKMLLLLTVLHCLLHSPGAQQSGHQRLATLAKVWGFLKYYHPAAAGGQPEWDTELIRIIPVVEKLGSESAFRQWMLEWYRGLPGLKRLTGNQRPIGDSIVEVVTLKDIQSLNVPTELRRAFERLFTNQLVDSSIYLTDRYKEYHLDFVLHTENNYAEVAGLSKELRLLALFRYWNTIRYFYPHRSRIPDWDQVLVKYISTFISARDSASYSRQVQELVHELPDAHSFYQENNWDKRYSFIPPFKIQFVSGKYLVGKVDPVIAGKFNYRTGDELVSINGQPVMVKATELKKIITGTNTSSLQRNIARELLLGMDSVLTVTFRRQGKLINQKVELHTWPVYRQQERSPESAWWEKKADGIWKVNFCLINRPDTLNKLFRDISNATAVIWDMRGYPNFAVTGKLEEYLFRQPMRIGTDLNASVHFPGMFIRHPIVTGFNADTSLPRYDGPMLVLVNEETQSLSESVSFLLRNRPNTWTMGRQTAGTTGNISRMDMPGGIKISYTGVGVSGSMQHFLQGEGVRLDYPVRLNVESFNKTTDPIFDQAMRWAKRLKNNTEL